MKQLKPAKLISKRYLVCPNCNEKEHLVEHILERKGSFGPWYCDCGVKISGSFVNGEIQVKTEPDDREKCTSLLIYRYSDPLFLVVDDHIHNSKDEDWLEKIKYYYHEHTCPTNILRNTETMYVGDNSDCHGAFQLLAIKRGEHSGFHDGSGEPPFSEQVKLVLAGQVINS